MRTVFEAAGGNDGLLRLATAWHHRVMADEIVSHAFSHGFHPQHTERLAAYWAEALGGPSTYSERYADETAGSFGGYQAIMFDPKQHVYWGASEMRKDGEAIGY